MGNFSSDVNTIKMEILEIKNISELRSSLDGLTSRLVTERKRSMGCEDRLKESIHIETKREKK